MKKDPAVAPAKKIVFSLMAPEAQAVLVAGDFTQWELGAVALKRQKNGLWKTTLALLPGTHRYRYIVDGQWVTDPACERQEVNPFGSEDCVITV